MQCYPGLSTWLSDLLCDVVFPFLLVLLFVLFIGFCRIKNKEINTQDKWYGACSGKKQTNKQKQKHHYNENHRY